MAKVNTHRFVELARKSTLVDEEALEQAVADLRTENDGDLPESPQALGNLLVERELLTP